jgi:hypothetical protein
MYKFNPTTSAGFLERFARACVCVCVCVLCVCVCVCVPVCV